MALKRELGLFSAALIVVGGIIGSGIFFTPAATAAALPSAGWVVFVWALGGVVALAGALTYAELGAMLPEAGGAYVYIREAFGPLPAFLSAWMNAGLISSGAIAAVAMGFAGYLARFVPLGAVGGPMGVAAITIVLLTATNILGIRPGVALQNVLTIAKIAALAGLIVGGVVLAAGGAGVAAVVPPPAPVPEPLPILRGLATAFVAVLFTIGGWQQMNMIAGEIKDPARNIPRALSIGIGIVIAVYLGVTGTYLAALGRDGLAASVAPAADTAMRAGGAAAATAITVAAMLSILGFVNVALLTNARVVFALGSDVPLLHAAGRVHARFGSPWVALVLLGGWSLALLLGTRGNIGTLLSGVVFADWIFFALGAACVFRLRALRPAAERPYRALGYPWLPAFFVVAGVVGIVSAYVSALKMSLFGTGLLGLGALLWLAARTKNETR